MQIYQDLWNYQNKYLKLRAKQIAGQYSNLFSNTYLDVTFSDILQEMWGMPFWIADPLKHEQKYHYTNDNKISKTGRPLCCFNHFIGLPDKKGVKKPLFDYQLDILRKLFVEKKRYFWIKKASGLGISELLIRLPAWISTCTDYFDNSRVLYFTGNRLQMAIDLIDRTKSLFQMELGFTLESAQTEIKLLNTQFEAIPAYHVDASRGYVDVSYALIDEGDYFPPSQQRQVRVVAERYIGKSNPFLFFVSTPAMPFGLFWQIEHETEEETIYDRIKLHWTVGQGKIYNDDDIATAQKSKSFGREYELQYGVDMGDIFTEEQIAQAIKHAVHPDYESYHISHLYPTTPKCIACDVGYSTSKTVVMMMDKLGDMVRVIYCKSFDTPLVKDASSIIAKLAISNNFTLQSKNRIYIDAAKVEFVAEVKDRLGENIHYQQILDIAEKQKIPAAKAMLVVPISFNKYNEKMTLHAQYFLNKGKVAIDPQFQELLMDLQTAKAKKNNLKLQVEKKASEGDTKDYFDTFIMGLHHFTIQ